MTDIQASAEWLPIAQADWDTLGETLIDLLYEEEVVREMISARDVADNIHKNGGPGEIISYRPSVQLIPLDLTPGASMEPKWVAMCEMPSMPRGWYWAAFPGAWEFYSPQLNMTKSINSGDTFWHELMSLRYWGPFAGPPDDRTLASGEIAS